MRTGSWNTRRLLAPSILMLTALAGPTTVSAHPGPDGEVKSHHNEVEARPKAEEAWQPARVGQQIYKQGRVATRAEATAAVGMRDDTTVSLRENTLLIIYGHHAERNKKLISMDATLETGALRSRLGELSGGKRARISTPSSTTAQEGGETLIKVDDEGTSRVHNHGDGKVGVSGKKGGKVRLKKGQGSKVKKGKRPQKPKPLPPTPQWIDGPHLFLGLPGHLGSIAGSWVPVEGAKAYFVEVATDAEGVSVIASVLVPASIDRFEIRGLAPGDYHVRVAAVDDDQFESLPSAGYAASIRAVDVANAEGAQMRWAQDEAGNETPVFVGGGVVGLPEGVSCEFAERQSDGVVTASQTVAPTCRDTSGQAVVGFAFAVQRPEVSLVDEGAIATVRGQESAHVIKLAGDHEVEALSVALPEGFELVSLARREDGDFDLRVRALDEAADESRLEVRLGTAEGPPLGELALVATTPESPPEPTPIERHMFEFGFGGFGAWMNDDHGLYDIAVAHQPFDGPAGGATLTLGYFPIRWAGLELDGRLGGVRGAGTRGTLWAFRAQVVGQLPYRVTPTAQIGFDMFGIRSDAGFVGNDSDFGFHWGLGAKAFLNRRAAITLGLNHLVYEALGDGQTNHLEFYGGVRVVLGRVSAGRKPR